MDITNVSSVQNKDGESDIPEEQQLLIKVS